MGLTPSSSEGALPTTWALDVDGNLTIAAGAESYIELDNALGPGVVLDSRFGSVFGPSAANIVPLAVSAAAGQTADIMTISDQAAIYLAVKKDGTLTVSKHAAPADATLAAGDMGLWFDQTDGVGNTKLMVKGKSADGTVKTASIVLA